MTGAAHRLDDYGREALAATAVDIISDFRGPMNRKLSRAKDFRWGRHGSLSLQTSTGLWFDFETWRGGDMIGFIQAERNCDFLAALDIAAAYVPELRRAGSSSSRPQPSRSAAKQNDDAIDEQKTADAIQIWIDSEPTAGTIAETYLQSRGLDLTDLPDEVSTVVRFHSRCPWQVGRKPAIVAVVRDVLTNEPLGIHRIGLTADGRKLDRPMLLGPCGDGAIKLSGDYITGGRLAIAEGVETTLSAMLRGFEPAWCAIDAGHIRKFPVLPEITELTIAVDHDDAGKTAAAECKARWLAAGKGVRTVMSKTVGEDMNDLLMRRGRRFPEHRVFDLLRTREAA